MPRKPLRPRPNRNDLVDPLVLEVHGLVRDQGWLADRALERALRREPKLWASERRAVAEAVYGIIRWQGQLDFLLGGRSRSRDALRRLARALRGRPGGGRGAAARGLAGRARRARGRGGAARRGHRPGRAARPRGVPAALDRRALRRRARRGRGARARDGDERAGAAHGPREPAEDRSRGPARKARLGGHGVGADAASRRGGSSSTATRTPSPSARSETGCSRSRTRAASSSRSPAAPARERSWWTRARARAARRSPSRWRCGTRARSTRSTRTRTGSRTRRSAPAATACTTSARASSPPGPRPRRSSRTSPGRPTSCSWTRRAAGSARCAASPTRAGGSRPRTPSASRGSSARWSGASPRLLKPGGRLVYATCSVGQTENGEVADYAEREVGLAPVPLAPLLGEERAKALGVGRRSPRALPAPARDGRILRGGVREEEVGVARAPRSRDCRAQPPPLDEGPAHRAHRAGPEGPLRLPPRDAQPAFARSLEGARFGPIRRIGKHLLVTLEEGRRAGRPPRPPRHDRQVAPPRRGRARRRASPARASTSTTARCCTSTTCGSSAGCAWCPARASRRSRRSPSSARIRSSRASTSIAWRRRSGARSWR